MLRRAVTFIGLLLIVLLVMCGCAKEPTNEPGGEQAMESAAQPGDTILIGIAGPMTGDQSKMGMDFKNGVQMAVDGWNNKGGVLGRQVVMKTEDDQHDPKQAVALANKLVSEGIVGLIGHFNSNCSIPASLIYEEGGVPMITPATTNPTFTERGLWNVFRVCGRDDQQGRVAALFAAGTLGVKRVAVLHDKTTYGQGLADEFKSNLPASAVVVYYGSVIQGDKDFKSVLTSIKSENPDIIYFGGIYPEGGLMVKQARELGLETAFLGGDGIIDQKFIEIGGAAAEGTYITFSPDPVSIPTAADFLNDYHARFGQHGPYSIYAYDAANILLKSISDTGSTDGHAVAEYIRANSFPGALGVVGFDSKGDNKVSNYVIWQVKDGEFAQITN